MAIVSLCVCFVTLPMTALRSDTNSANFDPVTPEFTVTVCSPKRRQKNDGRVHAALCNAFLVVTDNWWRGTVIERRSLTSELSLSCARPASDG